MRNKFPNYIEDKIKAELEKRNLLYKNLKGEDLSKRDTLEHINNKLLEFLKKILTNPKCINSRIFIKTCIDQIELEIKNEKIVQEAKNNLLVKIDKPQVKKQIPNPVQPMVKGKPIPYASGLTPEFIDKHRHLVRPCDPNEPIKKKEKQSNGFVYAKFDGYY
jgi:hypothetical protein